ncbi:MAG: hypothetical protein QM778_39045 [Myxococcales bacterium]
MTLKLRPERCAAALALTLCASSVTGCGRLRFDFVPTETDASTIPPAPGDAGGAPEPVLPIELDGGNEPQDGAPSVIDATIEDAATDAALAADTGADDGADASDGAVAGCGGMWILGACWYMAGYHTSCDTACQDRGGVNHPALSSVGTSSEGGTQQNCREVLTAFGEKAPIYSYRNDGLGFGCHAWMNGTTYWSDDPTPHFDSTFSGYSVTNMVCACAR